MKSIKIALLFGSILLIAIVTPACITISQAVSPPPEKVEPAKPAPVEPALSKDILFLEKIDAIPDYTQSDSAYGGFPGKGSEYCGPTSVSNGLMWLSENGFPNLAPLTVDRKKDQFDIINALGLPQYMDTGVKGTASVGTTPAELCRGIKQYILDKGYKYRRIEFQGWRTIPAEFDTKIKVIDLKWLKQGIQGYGAAWMAIGWYNYDAAAGEYKRVDGHWITLVGYGHDGNAANPNSLIVHNSLAAASPRYPKNEYILPEKINSGTLKGDYPGLPRSAEGYYKVNLLGKPASAEFCILDYAVVLEMQP